jgi:hypothetical protein
VANVPDGEATFGFGLACWACPATARHKISNNSVFFMLPPKPDPRPVTASSVKLQKNKILPASDSNNQETAGQGYAGVMLGTLKSFP